MRLSGFNRLVTFLSDADVNNNLTFYGGGYDNSGISGNYDITLQGDLTIDGSSGTFGTNCGKTRIIFNGTSDQSISSISGTNYSPRIQVDKPSGDVSFTGTLYFTAGGSTDIFHWKSGSSLSGGGQSGTYFREEHTFRILFDTTPSGGFGGFDFQGYRPSVIEISGEMPTQNVRFSRKGYSGFKIKDVGSGVVSFTGDIECDTDQFSLPSVGIITFKATGSANQQMFGTHKNVPGDLEIDKSGGVFTLSRELRVDNNLTITSGDFSQTDKINVVGSFSQSGGNFVGGSENVTVNGILSISGGSFQSTSGRLSVIDSNATIAAGTFSHNNGECYFYHDESDKTIDVNGESFYDLIFHIEEYVSYVTLQSNIDVNNNLTLKGGDDNRSGLRGSYNITVQGNIYYDSSAGRFGSVSRQVTIVLNGTGDQELSASGGFSYSPFLKIDKPSGDVAINGDGIRVLVRDNDEDAIHWASGPSVSGDCDIGIGFTDNVSTNIKFDVTPSGEISELVITGYYSSRITISGTIPAHDVRLETLHLSNHRVIGGTVEFSGDFISNTPQFFDTSTTAFKAIGSNDQSLTGTAGDIPSSLEIDKTGGVFSLSLNLTVGNDLVISSGSFYTLGFNVTCDNIENNSGPFIISDSTITCGSLTNNSRGGVIIISSSDAVFNTTSFVNNSYIRTDYPGRLPSNFVNNKIVSPSWKHGFQTVPISETLIKSHNKITPHAFTYKANS